MTGQGAGAHPPGVPAGVRGPEFGAPPAAAAPVVEGEWPITPGTTHRACWDNAPVSAPRFLNYLQARGFGLIMTMLVKGQLIQTANLNDPTRFRSNWSCTSGLDQGVGHQAQQWFIRQNG